MAQKTALIYCIGRELLEGIVLDRNAHYMAGRLSSLGFRVRWIQVLDNVLEEMVEAFRHGLATGPTYVLTTGGMGPAFDDITREAVAKVAGVPLHQDPDASDMLGRAYRRLFAKGVVDDADLNDDRLKMAQVPSGATCYENPIGTAPAVRLSVGDTTFFLMPGVPEEMQRVFSLYLVPALEAEGAGIVRKARHIEYHGRDESAISRMLADLSRRHPGIHSRARVQGSEENITIRITLFGEHSDEKELEHRLERAESDLRARLGLEVQKKSRGASDDIGE